MFDTEKFIGEVEKRPAIYNLNLKEYTMKDVKVELWNEIGMEMYEKWNELSDEDKTKLGKELRTRWKSIRDQYKKEVSLENKVKSGQARTKKRKYLYYNQLLFLKIYLKDRSTPSQKVENQEETEIRPKRSKDDASIPKSCNVLEADCMAPRKTLSPKRRSERSEISDITTVSSESVVVPRPERAEDTMGNRSFLMSLLPFMNNMPQNNLINLRLKIMELFNTHCLSPHPPSEVQLHRHACQPNLQQPQNYEIPFYMQPTASSSRPLFVAAPMSPSHYSDSPSPVTSALSPVEYSITPSPVKSEDIDLY